MPRCPAESPKSAAAPSVEKPDRPGVRTWSAWLVAKLKPARVDFEGLAPEPGGYGRWSIRFRSGREVMLHVPAYLVRADDAVYDRVVFGLDSYDWIMLLKREEAVHFEVDRNGLLFARADGADGE